MKFFYMVISHYNNQYRNSDFFTMEQVLIYVT